jgi:hypothetical protein
MTATAARSVRRSAGEVTLDGRRVLVDRPRIRAADTGGLPALYGGRLAS